MSHETDLEIEELKLFWYRYGRFLILAIVILLLTWGGIHYYRNYQKQQLLEASNLYQQMTTLAIQIKNNENEDQKLDNDYQSINYLASKLEKKHYDSLYFVLGQLLLVHFQVERDELKQAADNLERLLKQPKVQAQPALNVMVTLRLGRVLLAASQQNSAKVLNLLDNLKSNLNSNEVLQLKADALVGVGKVEQAQSIYSTLLQKPDLSVLQQNWLKMKLAGLLNHK